MTREVEDFDTSWEEKYQSGHQQRAPWDLAVSFVYRFRPKNQNIQDIRILEVGCGTAANLRFFAKEGFQVSGIDASKTAIEKAKLFFHEDGLTCDLRIGDFTKLDFENSQFDLVIDRASLTCVSAQQQKKAISEIHRVLKLGGHFLYNPYADTHSSRKFGTPHGEDLITNIDNGTLKGIGQIRFTAEKDFADFFPSDLWAVRMKLYETRQDMLADPETNFHSSWSIILEKR